MADSKQYRNGAPARRPADSEGEPARHVLVIGGGGYVGSVLVRLLLGRGYRVRVLDNFLYNNSLSLAGLYEEPWFSLVRGDLREPSDLLAALEGISDVVLLASLVGDPVSKKYPALTRGVNGLGSQSVFNALAGRRIGRFVFTSTCSNYGLRNSNSPATEEADLNPLSLYAETKVEFERHVLAQARDTDFCSTILRIATAYGISPRMRFDLTVNEFTRQLAEGETIDVYDRDTWRPYCHIRDISRAIIRVLESPAEKVRGQVFNVGSDEDNYTKAMIVDEIARHLDCRSRVRFVEGGADARNYRVSFQKIRESLNFRAEHSVKTYIPDLIVAVQQGLFAAPGAMTSYYGNYEIRPGVS